MDHETRALALTGCTCIPLDPRGHYDNCPAELAPDIAAALREVELDALERAADVADQHATCDGIAQNIAAAIRALAKAKGEDG